MSENASPITRHLAAASSALTPAVAPKGRLDSLDAFRGAIMLLMASSGFGIPQVAKHFPESAVWRVLGGQCEHREWVGCSLWDLIQPAFMFMVGVAVPWSVANRQARGQTFRVMFGHALWRALLLVVLAVFLTSAWSKQTEWVFTNVLAQIGLGYPFLFLLAFTKPRTQWLAAFGLLVACWLAFALYPVAPPGFDWKAVGVPDEWPHLTGFARHWEKNANLGSAFDVWFLNLFPRAAPFTHNLGGYQTLNFVPSLVTMILGLIAGRLLRSEVAMSEKLKRLVIAGLAGVAVGKAVEMAGLCPIVKRLWTTSWAVFSAGMVTLLLAGFVALIDWRGWRRSAAETAAGKGWAFPLIVAGLNPITLYCLWQLTPGFIRASLRTHLGQGVFDLAGATYAPILERVSVLCVLWLIVFWMFRRRIFVRV